MQTQPNLASSRPRCAGLISCRNWRTPATSRRWRKLAKCSSGGRRDGGAAEYRRHGQDARATLFPHAHPLPELRLDLLKAGEALVQLVHQGLDLLAFDVLAGQGVAQGGGRVVHVVGAFGRRIAAHSWGLWRLWSSKRRAMGGGIRRCDLASHARTSGAETPRSSAN